MCRNLIAPLVFYQAVMCSYLSFNQVFLITVWNFELYMIPLALLLIFVYNFIRPVKGKVSSIQDSQVSKDSEFWHLTAEKCVNNKKLPPPPNHGPSPFRLRCQAALQMHSFCSGGLLSCVIWSLLSVASYVPESWPAWGEPLVHGYYFHAGSTCLCAHMILCRVPVNNLLNH